MRARTAMVVACLACASCDDEDAESTGGSSGAGTTGTVTTDTTEPSTSTTLGSAGSTSLGEPGTSSSSSAATTAATGSSSAADSSTTAVDACANERQDPDEADVDCGGPCGPCPTGSTCTAPEDCEAQTCEAGSCLGPADGCNPKDVQGAPGGMGWADSYSVDGRCYCASSFDHNIGDIMVDTPAGPRTVLEVCEAIGPGPGIEGNPIYNDIQCGNGPANDAGDEDWCPGRVDQGEPGCCIIGPTWDLSVFER